MKIVVSYISSLFSVKKTINMINETSANGIHVDLMDGKYVGNLNFDENLFEVLKEAKLPLDVHAMVLDPENYLDKIIALKPDCVYIHAKTTKEIKTIFEKLRINGIKRGLAINPEEDITLYEELYSDVDRILVMSVNPGKGGQSFLENTPFKLEELSKLKEQYNFSIYVDGGINDDTIKFVSKYADGVVSGSFICKSEDYENQIEKLRLSL